MTARSPLRTVSLTHAEADAQAEDILAISADVSPWTRDSLLMDLPDKWHLSFYLARDGRPVAYAILSRRFPGRVHIHQFMVHAQERRHGLGRQLLAEAARRAANTPLSLKVAIENTGAQRFYARHGFVVSRREPDYLWMERPADGALSLPG